MIKTLDRLKSDAKKLKREQGIPHTQALEVVSIANGFQNYRHARRELLGEGGGA